MRNCNVGINIKHSLQSSQLLEGNMHELQSQSTKTARQGPAPRASPLTQRWTPICTKGVLPLNKATIYHGRSQTTACLAPPVPLLDGMSCNACSLTGNGVGMTHPRAASCPKSVRVLYSASARLRPAAASLLHTATAFCSSICMHMSDGFSPLPSAGHTFGREQDVSDL